MVSSRSTIFLKIMIDLCYFGVVLGVYFLDVWLFVKDFYIGLMGVTWDYVDYGLEAQVYGDFDKFKDNLCFPAFVDSKPICDNKDNLQIAGIVFVTFSSIAHLMMAYGILGLIGKGCGCNFWGFLRFDWVHYVYPVVYIFSIGLYLAISQFWTMSVPDKYKSNSNYDLKVYFGLVFMCGASIISVISAFYFWKNQQKMNSYLFPRDSYYKSIEAEKAQRSKAGSLRTQGEDSELSKI